MLNLFFRGDSHYTGGPVGRPLGAEADAADIQNWADHVLRKESRLSSRYTSLTTELAIARRFACNEDRHVYKVAAVGIQHLESEGEILTWDPDQVHAALLKEPSKLAKQANDVWSAMRRNRELLVEGTIPENLIVQLLTRRRRR